MARKISWRKSSYSGGQGGNCIEVADDASRMLVRDTTDRQGPTLRFSADAWRRLVEQVKADVRLASDSRARGVLSGVPLFASVATGFIMNGDDRTP